MSKISNASAAIFLGCLSGLSGSVYAAEPFTIVALPDTQNYTSTNARNNTYFKGQTQWIADNLQSKNIAFVLHLGDIQNLGNPYYANGEPTPWLNGDERQWVRADASLDILDNNHVPYSVVPGNHDYLHYNQKKEPGYYLKWFGPQRFEDKPTYGGASPATPTSPAGMNTYHRFNAGGYDFLNIALQYKPDKHDLTWAQKVINENPGVPTIVTTHAYISKNGYQYKYIFDDFVKLNPQIVATMNGHLTGEHLNTDTNIAGQPVQQMLVDYQGFLIDGAFRGGGYLRTLTFENDRVNVKSYSPVLDEYLTDSDSQFSFDLDLQDRFGPANHGGVVKSMSFRQGANGYTGARDTYIAQGQPNATHFDDTIAWVDGDRDGNTAGKQPSQALIRFDFISEDGNLPEDAAIDQATLTIHTSDLPQSQSSNTISLHRLLQPWTRNATWNSKGDGISINATEAIYAANGTAVPSISDGVVTFDVTESVFAWMAGAENYGWVLVSEDGNGWRFDTSEAADLFDRPSLDVTYRVVPEPGTIGIFACGVLLTLGRRRRPVGARA